MNSMTVIAQARLEPPALSSLLAAPDLTGPSGCPLAASSSIGWKNCLAKLDRAPGPVGSRNSRALRLVPRLPLPEYALPALRPLAPLPLPPLAEFVLEPRWPPLFALMDKKLKSMFICLDPLSIWAFYDGASGFSHSYLLD